MIEEKDYQDYLDKLKGRIFKILPMYETKIKTLPSYVSALTFEIEGVKKVTDEYDGAWLVQTKGILKNLEEEVLKEENVDLIRSKVLGLVNSKNKVVKKDVL